MNMIEAHKHRRNTERDMLISGAQAAELVGVSVPTFYKMAKEKEKLAPEPSAGQVVVWSLFTVLEWVETRELAAQMKRTELVRSWRTGDGGDTQ